MMDDRQQQQPQQQRCGTIAEEEIRAASRRRRQARKTAQQTAFKTGVWDRCQYQVPGKERYCAQQRSKHSAVFCGTHMGETEEKGRRVPCPVDPNHTVFEQQLASHAKICNLAILQARMEAQPYYSKGINSGPPLQEEDKEEEEERATAAVVGPALDDTFLLDLISRVAAAHLDVVGEIPTEVLDHIPEVQELHRARTEDGTGFRKGRHVLQQASLVGHLVKRGLVGPARGGDSSSSSGSSSSSRPGMLHVEMGAGKGALGYSIAASFPGAEVTMVERSSVRRKAENRLDGVSARARIDIRDLNMAGLPSLGCDEGEGGRPVVAVAKHLCGVATDLALRAMLTLPPSDQASHESNTSGGGVGGGVGGGSGGDHDGNDDGGSGGGGDATTATTATRAGGVAFATCCHHACNWRDYTGKDFLSRQGFTARDFDAMIRISAWISLEPDVGARKNNKYPDDKHPAAVSSSSPQPSSGKFLAAVATPAIAEEEEEASHATDSERSALDNAAAAAAAAAASAAATAAAASRIPETSQEKTGGGHESGDTQVGGSDVDERAEGRGRAGAEGGEARGAGSSSVLDAESSSLSSSPSTSPLPLLSLHLPTDAPSTTLSLRPTETAKAEHKATAVAADDDDGGDEDDGHQGRVLPTPTPPSVIGGVVRFLPNALPLTPAEKAKAARECKRLLDAGRRAFIEERLGLTSEMVHFVGRDITPENALLLGFRVGE